MATVKSNASDKSKASPVTPDDIVASMKSTAALHTKVYSSGDTAAITKAANKVKVIEADLVTLERVLKRFNSGYYN
jgi:hypothetical protein